jgi:hypothetical protein
MNHLGQVEAGIQKGNLAPICLEEPPAAGKDAAEKERLARLSPRGQPLPYCPKAWLEEKDDKGESKWLFKYRDDTIAPHPLINVDALAWAARGAVNAGLSAFLYLQELESCKRSATPPFNRCEDLGKVGACAAK